MSILHQRRGISIILKVKITNSHILERIMAKVVDIFIKTYAKI